LLQIVIWKVVLPKPMLSVAKEYACHGVLDVSTYQGFPPCFILPWERDPANFGIGINFSEVAVASKGKDSRTLLQNEVKGVELLAKRSFLQEVVFRSKQPLLIKMIDIEAKKSTAMCKTFPNVLRIASLNSNVQRPKMRMTEVPLCQTLCRHNQAQTPVLETSNNLNYCYVIELYIPWVLLVRAFGDSRSAR
jgi:hypothetical protein